MTVVYRDRSAQRRQARLTAAFTLWCAFVFWVWFVSQSPQMLRDDATRISSAFHHAPIATITFAFVKVLFYLFLLSVGAFFSWRAFSDLFRPFTIRARFESYDFDDTTLTLRLDGYRIETARCETLESALQGNSLGGRSVVLSLDRRGGVVSLEQLD